MIAGVIFVAACIVGRWLIFDCDELISEDTASGVAGQCC